MAYVDHQGSLGRVYITIWGSQIDAISQAAGATENLTLDQIRPLYIAAAAVWPGIFSTTAIRLIFRSIRCGLLDNVVGFVGSFSKSTVMAVELIAF